VSLVVWVLPLEFISGTSPFLVSIIQGLNLTSALLILLRMNIVSKAVKGRVGCKKYHR
jgi:hypothetical protein